MAAQQAEIADKSETETPAKGLEGNGAVSQATISTGALTRDSSGPLALVGLLLHDKDGPKQCIRGHQSMVTESGRLKMLHRDPEKVNANWKRKRSTQVLKALDPILLSHSYHRGVHTEVQEPESPAGRADVAANVMVEFDSTELATWESSNENVVAVVRRLGSLAGTTTCNWIVENGNTDPKYFGNFAGSHGTIVFKEGERFASIELPAIKDPTWNVDAFYVARIVSCQDSSGCTVHLGRNCDVHVYSLNSDQFPADAQVYDEKAGCMREDVPLRTIVRAFLWHNFTEIPRRATAGFILSLVPGLIYYVQASINEATVNCVSNGGDACEIFSISLGHSVPLIYLALLQLVVFISSFAQDRQLRRLRLGGQCTKKLRSNLFATMMYMTKESSELYDTGDIAKVIDTDVMKAIKQVWIASFQLCTAASELVARLAITWLVAVELASTSTMTSAVLFLAPVVMILIMVAMLLCTMKEDFKLAEKARQTEENWHAFVNMCEACKSVIHSYLQCDSTIVSVDTSHAAINKAQIAETDSIAKNLWAVRLIFGLVSIAVTLTLGFNIRSSQATVALGTFTMVTKTVVDFGKSLLVVAAMVKDLFSGAAAVKKISEVLNRETMRKATFRRQGNANMGEAQEDSALTLKAVEYVYPSSSGRAPMRAVWPTQAVIYPDQLVCLKRNKDLCPQEATDRALGVDTLFKVLGKQLLPSSGSFHMPARWRVVYVPVSPVLFDGTLMYNLAYSRLSDEVPIEEEVIWNACRELGMSSVLIGDQDYDVGTMGERLKMSDRLCVSLVRALYFDTDVLLISSVLDVLGQASGIRALQFLKQFIRCRGLPGYTQDVPAQFRHRKLVMYTSKIAAVQEVSDAWLNVEEKNGKSGKQDNFELVIDDDDTEEKSNCFSV